MTEGLSLSLYIHSLLGFPGGSASAGNAFDPSVKKIPRRRAGQPTPIFLPGESHGQRSLASYDPWGHEESDTTEATEHEHS